MTRAINVAIMPRSARHRAEDVEGIEAILEQWFSERDHIDTGAIKHELFLKLTAV
jgi:hypothetical protein